MKRKPISLMWLMAVMMLAALACTCGSLGKAAQGVQTARAVVTQGQGLATEIATTGALETLQAAASEIATSGAVETFQAASTQTGGGSGEVPDDIPIYSDNAGVQTFGGVFSYQAHADLATVTQYYQTEMPNNGWEQAKDPVLTDAASVLVYKKGDKTVNINLIASDQATVVAIQIQP